MLHFLAKVMESTATNAAFNLLDAHCHLRAMPSVVSSRATTPWASGIFFGTHPDVDWDAVERIAALPQPSPTIAGFGFGVHPWYAPPSVVDAPVAVAEAATETEHTCACSSSIVPPSISWNLSSLLVALEERLVAHPSAWVGEIGLDALRPADRSHQQELFVQQMMLASRYHRAVSVHCVRAFGPLLTILMKLPKAHFPPAIVLHGFTGSPEFVKSLLKLPKGKSERIYFGVGEQTSFRLRDFSVLMSTIPPTRILLESDQHWILPPNDCGAATPSPDDFPAPSQCCSNAFMQMLPAHASRHNAEMLIASLAIASSGGRIGLAPNPPM